MLYFLVAIGLFFDFLNGFHDSSNIVATVISSRALRPRTALYFTAAAEFIAPFLFGVAVAWSSSRRCCRRLFGICSPG
jgi:PiT family inorganic phosphate transporter